MSAPQRSPEWYEARKGRVTGSAVGAILDLSPFQTRDDVMRRMVREALGAESEIEDNPPMAYGRIHEDGAIMEFEMETGLTVTPAPFVPKDEWLGASPDGFTSDGGLIEVKAPYSLRNGGDFKPLSMQEHYAAQIQIELHCTGLPHAWFYQWAPHATSLERVERDDEWLNANIPILRQFWAEFQDELKNPDEHLVPRRVTIDTPEAARMIEEYDQLTEAIERATERKKDLLASMVEKAGGKNAMFGGRKLTLVEKAGSVAYAKIVKEKLPGLDTSPWRGKPSEYWRVS